MPAAAALAIRALIQAIVSVGSWIAFDIVVMPLIEKGIRAYQTEKGMTAEEAEDSMANEIIEGLLMVGVSAATIKSKIPTKVAERLKFTTKGYAKRTIGKKAASDATIILPTPTTIKTTAALSAASTIASKVETLKATRSGFKITYDLTVKTLGAAALVMMAVGNWIDFGNWNQGAYQGTFQKIYAKITGGLLTPDADFRQSLTTSSEVFDKVFNTYKISGATNIVDPFKGQTVEFNRENLLDLIDKVGAKLLIAKGSASTKEVLLATQMMITFNGTVAEGSTNLVGTGGGAVISELGTGSTLPKVYTGIVTQGVVGRGLVFEARPDDLIESIAELRTAAANNLTPYLQSLLGKIVYEIKIVSSYVTREGITMRGETQQIRNGSYAGGGAKYKTVTNKFATLVIYAVTDKGTRAKLSTIVLGPTNSAKLTVGVDDIASVEAQLPSLVTTTDINEITGIESSNAVTVSNPPAAIINPTAAPKNSEGIPKNAKKIEAEDDAPEGWNVERVKSGLYTWPDEAPQSAAEQQARSLSEWYAARGDVLPSLSDRARTYEFFGLGTASYYVGSAEQNTKLLQYLKGELKVEEEEEEEAPKRVLNGGTTKQKAAAAAKKKEPAAKKVIRSYTTTSGEKVTKYSDGTETRVRAKK